MRSKDYVLSVIVKDHHIDEYNHEGSTFVEGRKGSDFELSFKNASKGRVLVVPSVDGLSPLDGLAAGPESRGYVVAAGATLIIPGWTFNDEQVARFMFENKDKSYGSHTEGGTANSGVVGVLVYAEKQEEKPKEIHHHHTTIVQPPARILPVYPSPIWPHYPYNGSPVWYGSQPVGTCAAGQAGSLTASSIRSMRDSATTSHMSGTAIPTSNVVSQDAIFSSQVSDTLARYGAKGEPLSKEEFEGSDEAFGLGTGWGEKVDFKINHVTFNRGDLVAQMLIYYDTRRNLEKRGIVIRPQRALPEELPQAFVGLGCKPPPGWTG
jgi:hypothetical protein